MEPKIPEVVAVDFDHTLCDSKFPELGPPIPKVVEIVRRLHSLGSKIILWTCRVDTEERKYLTEALEWCKENDVPIDAANENPWNPWNSIPEINPTGYRKVCADVYIDDCAINTSEFTMGGLELGTV